MGEYAAYIWSAYGAAGAVLIALALASWRWQRKSRQLAERLRAQSPRRARGSAQSDEAS